VKVCALPAISLRFARRKDSESRLQPGYCALACKAISWATLPRNPILTLQFHSLKPICSMIELEVPPKSFWRTSLDRDWLDGKIRHNGKLIAWDDASRGPYSDDMANLGISQHHTCPGSLSQSAIDSFLARKPRNGITAVAGLRTSTKVPATTLILPEKVPIRIRVCRLVSTPIFNAEDTRPELLAPPLCTDA
jgi:hypothetical protein